MEGKYLFEGVKDFSTIQNLHEEKQVYRQHVYMLRDRWIQNNENDVMVSVEKINNKTMGLPEQMANLLYKSIQANIEKRPNSIEEFESVIKHIIKEQEQEQECLNDNQKEEKQEDSNSFEKLKELVNQMLSEASEEHLTYLFMTKNYINELEKNETVIIDRDYAIEILKLCNEYKGLRRGKEIKKDKFVQISNEIIKQKLLESEK